MTLQDFQPDQAYFQIMVVTPESTDFFVSAVATEEAGVAIVDALNNLDEPGRVYGLVKQTISYEVLVDAVLPEDEDPLPDPEPEPEPEPEGGTDFRDAGTGRYVTEEYADEHPDTTVSEGT